MACLDKDKSFSHKQQMVYCVALHILVIWFYIDNAQCSSSLKVHNLGLDKEKSVGTSGHAAKNEAIPSMEVVIQSSKVFRFAFNPHLFGWYHNHNSAGTSPAPRTAIYSYRPSLKGLPDMPYWMRYKYSHRHKAGNLSAKILVLFRNVMFHIIQYWC